MNTDTAVERPLVKARFAWDEEDVSFEGWHDPAQRWNGFAVPGFEKAEADRLAAWQTAEHAKDPEGYPPVAFDAARDAYIVDNRVSYPDEEDPTDAYSGGDFPCEDGVTRRLYHVGGWSWTWSEVATDDDGRPVLPATEAERVTIAEARVRDRLGSDLPIETANGKVLGTVDLTFRLDGGEAGVECEYAPCPYGPAAPGRWVASHGAHGDTYLCGGCLADREAERPRIGEPALP